MRFRGWKSIRFGLAAAMLALCLVSLFPQEAPKAKEPELTDEQAAQAPYTPSLRGMPDAGEFLLYVNEEKLATHRFEWKADGSFTGSFDLTLAGQTVHTETTISVDDQGRWTKVEIVTPRGPQAVEREGCLIRREFKGEKSTGRIAGNSLLYLDYAPSLFTALIKAVDKSKKAAQTLKVFVSATVDMDVSVEVLPAETRVVDGKEQTFERYRFSLAGIDITIWQDAAGKVVLEDVPVQKAYFVRPGYEILTKQETVEDPLLSKPSCEFTLEKDVMVPMRDGVKLATDLYRPVGVEKAPLVFIRTPYGKQMQELDGKFWARRGYACAVQDCRGRFASQGVWEPFMNEAQDGYDAIEWLAVQPWCSGKVGMIGASYVGWVQWWAASRKPPHLTAIIPNVAPPDPHWNIPYENGAFFLLGSIWWAKILETNATADLTGETMAGINEEDYSKVLKTLPVIELDKVLLKKENPYWRNWIKHPDNDAYWDRANFLKRLKDVTIPAFHQSGWFDGDAIGTKLNYLAIKKPGLNNQKMTVGPWGHTDRASRRIGDKDFGSEAIVDLQRDYLRWFDFWLKDVKNGIDTEPLVQLFVMDDNSWRKGNTYPLEGTVMKDLYLSSGGKANTSKGDGRLVWEKGASPAEADRYTYDPGDPTPSPEFQPTRSKEERKKEVLSDAEEKKKAEAFHRSVTDSRADILVYETEALKEPLVICGPLSATLYASSSAKDTDWYVSLSLVDAEGGIHVLGKGKVRARYRKSLAKPELLTPGKVEKYELDLWHTGLKVKTGYKLRVEVASAIFPFFSRNLNTGKNNETETDFVKADQVIHHSAKYPSCIHLPVLPK